MGVGGATGRPSVRLPDRERTGVAHAGAGAPNADRQERGPHEAAELVEVHYGTWVEEGEEGEDPARGSSDARSLQHRAVWLLVFRWRPSPGPEITPPPGFAYRLHGMVDAQTGEP